MTVFYRKYDENIIYEIITELLHVNVAALLL